MKKQSPIILLLLTICICLFFLYKNKFHGKEANKVTVSSTIDALDLPSKVEAGLTKSEADTSSEERNNEESTPDVAKKNIEFEEKKVYKTHTLNEGEDTTTFEVTYLTMKSYDNPVVADKMNAFIEKEVLKMASGGVPDSATFENLEEAAEQFIADFVTEGKELPNDFLRVPWSYEGNVVPILDTLGIVSLLFNEYLFSGGAHGNGYQEFHNFDLETGAKIQLNDLLSGNYEGALNQLIERYFREMEGLSDTASLVEGGLFEDSITLNNNFYLTKNELGFYYNSYEIAPYAVGPKEIVIPYEELKKWIRKDSKLGKLVSM